ncbi:PAP2 superfamily protein [Oryzisolibacter propanilivorax]|uniref:PAP2 superfamily protein n=1 Tax=Oryzisolibacter propanilivorax TaxID=1527607 RepID=A0A1G9QGP1_9BURK|nr:phosphatase PAP2 family protein [Oryzisolibacter propanilivorax]SDM09465.1 PAP2 superfamily protein [Oryzisolibacter propanilivorax]
MRHVSSPAATRPAAWQGQLAQRLTYLWPVKAAGTTAFMVLFFQAYFFVLRHPSRAPWVMPEIWLDRWVPFTPQAFAVYAFLWVYVSLPPALIGNFRGLLRYTVWVTLLCAVSLLIFWAFPTQVPDAAIDWAVYPYLAFLKGIDASGNACPSLHVASAVFTACWLHRLLQAMQAPRALVWTNHALCLAIAWSTLATLQHVALDALAGALLGAGCAWLSLHRAQSALRAPALALKAA